MPYFFPFLFAATFAFGSGAKPPKIYIDKGACPFECCTYREWTVKRDTPLFDGIGKKAVVGTAKAGKRVTAVTGEVHVIPTKIVIREAHGDLKPNDAIYLLTSEI